MSTPEFSVSVIVDHEKCIAHKGCRVCIDVCPTDILAYDEGAAQVKMVYDECWYCLPCAHDCPTGAIRVEIPYLLR
ncbi:MAG TPA: 4Fe-4S dicluster domain-containing protein [Rhodocyclaceae bacterium]|jgi:NAD-dependent dihydropyrimidine dehydrogenase PreA subunit|nr:4Fe-4S dicluster domain-containing protein [Rhodocyclaceae bacterium]